MVDVATKEEEKLQMQRKFALRCKQGHPLRRYQNGFKRKVGPDGTIVQPKSSQLNCVNCNDFTVAENGFASCKQTCDYFLCPKCALCTECGSILMLKNTPHYDYMNDEYGNEDDADREWGYCRQCSKHFKYSNEPKEKQMYLACQKGSMTKECSFMVCRKCCESTIGHIIIGAD